jgi:phytoene dehydrogenase-like protein
MSLVGDPIRRPGTLFKTVRAPVGSISDKLRLVRRRARLARTSAPDLLRQTDGTTLDALEAEGFSPGMVESFFRPLLGGIQLDPSLSTSRRMLDVILKGLFAGDVAVPAHGMGAIPDQMARRLPRHAIQLDSAVTWIGTGSVRLAGGRTVSARRIICAVEGPAAGRLLGLPPVGSHPASCVWFAADRPPLRGRYVVLDGSGRGPALNIAVMSNVAPEYAPEGSALIAAACPGVRDPWLEPRVREQLELIWGSGVASWRHLRTDAIAHGQPRQDPPFSPKQRVALGNGLFVCGDHRDTGSIQGALYSGRRCADAVLSSLT